MARDTIFLLDPNIWHNPISHLRFHLHPKIHKIGMSLRRPIWRPDLHILHTHTEFNEMATATAVNGSGSSDWSLFIQYLSYQGSCQVKRKLKILLITQMFSSRWKTAQFVFSQDWDTWKRWCSLERWTSKRTVWTKHRQESPHAVPYYCDSCFELPGGAQAASGVSDLPQEQRHSLWGLQRWVT